MINSSDSHFLSRRIITHKGLTKHVVEGSVQVVKFDEELSLSYIKVSI